MGNWFTDTFGVGGTFDPGGQYLGLGASAPKGSGSAWYGGGTPPQMPGYENLNYQRQPTAYAAAPATYQGASYDPASYNPTSFDPHTYQPGELGDPSLATAERGGLGAYRDFATGTGDSPWATAARAGEDQRMIGARDSLARQTQGGIDQSMDRIAMNGGLSGGASERAANSGRDAGLLARQGLEGDSMKRQNDITLQDTAARQDFLKGLPGQDLAFANFDKSNSDVINQFDQAQWGAENTAGQYNAAAGNAAASANANAANSAAATNAAAQNSAGQFGAGAQNQANAANAGAMNQTGQYNATTANAAGQFDANLAMGEAQRHSDYDLTNYQTQAGIYAGQQLAQSTAAQAAAAGNKKSGSSFLCTELRERNLMNGRESKRMLEFMLRSIFERAQFFAWYFKHGEKLIQSLKKADTDWARLKKLGVDDILELIENGKEARAQDKYIALIENLNDECDEPMGEMPQSIYVRCLASSVLYFPVILSRKSTWKWLKGYLGTKAARAARRHLRRVA